MVQLSLPPQRIPLATTTDLLAARHAVRVALAHSGLSPVRRTRVATAISELAREVLELRGGALEISSIGNDLALALSGLGRPPIHPLLPREVRILGDHLRLPMADRPDEVMPASRLHGLQLRERELEHARQAARLAHLAVEAKSRRLLRVNGDLEMVAAAAAHDLKEPLQVIRLFSTALSRQPEAAESASRIRAAADRMGDMLQGLMALLKVDGAVREAATDARGAIEAVLEDLSHLREETAAVVEVHGTARLGVAEPHVRAVVQNLLANAMKYSRPGVPPRIRVEVVGAEEVALSVCDNGRGIPPGAREQVFTLFKRLKRDKDDAGTGVGLAFVNRVVSAYDGRITLADGPDGVGTRVTVTLPGSPLPSPSPPASPSS
jgi:signal transduction histidine kinase